MTVIHFRIINIKKLFTIRYNSISEYPVYIIWAI